MASAPGACPPGPFTCVPGRLAAALGLSAGALATMAVVLGGTVASVSLGAIGPGPAIGTATGSPAITPLLASELALGETACPTSTQVASLLAGGALADPALAASLTSAATALCTSPDPSATLLALLPGATDGQVALVLAHALSVDPTLDGTAATAITFAAANLGAPYRWGGTGPGGFDCSGLTLEAYRAAGIALPRVAQDQFDAGPRVPAGAALEPGDLVFFGGGPQDVSHVGLYIGGGDMIDAPHTGAFVRVEATPITVGAPFGSDIFVGATRPG
jgi:cell wall-associated NlpC family hydrolase